MEFCAQGTVEKQATKITENGIQAVFSTEHLLLCR